MAPTLSLPPTTEEASDARKTEGSQHRAAFGRCLAKLTAPLHSDVDSEMPGKW